MRGIVELPLCMCVCMCDAGRYAANPPPSPSCLVFEVCVLFVCLFVCLECRFWSWDDGRETRVVVKYRLRTIDEVNWK